MRFFSSVFTCLVISGNVFLALACSTTRLASELEPARPAYDLSCQLSIEDGKTLHIYVQSLSDVSPEISPSNSESAVSMKPGIDTLIHGYIKNKSGTVVASQRQLHEARDVLAESAASFQIAGKSIQVSGLPAPMISAAGGVGACVQIFQTAGSNERSPRCNAIGTPSQGWYLGGKLLRHDRGCHASVLSCGLAKSEGWFVQRKLDRVLLAKESCSWQKEVPQCTQKNGIKGWHLRDRLVARDDECGGKVAECGFTAEGHGWVAFKRSLPRFYAEGRCRSPSKTSATEPNISAH